MAKNMSLSEVVVIIPYTDSKVLLQLRDIKDDIPFPGCWVFLGGSIGAGETPENAVERELFEAIGYRPGVMNKIGLDIITELKNLHSHAFCCPSVTPVEKIKLGEGLDVGLFLLEEIMTEGLYSCKMRKSFPVAEKTYLYNTLRKLWEYLKR